MGKIFGGAPKQQAPTPIPAAKPIPVQDTRSTDLARKKMAAQAQQRGGVAATVLTDTLGG